MWEVTIADNLPVLKLNGRGGLTDINGRRRYFKIIEPPIIVKQSTYHEKVFIFQRVQFEDDGTIELRLGYYIIGKKPRMRGRWVWGQSCPLMPEGDFTRLMLAAKNRGWMMKEEDIEDIALGEITHQRMRSFRRKDALTHQQVWGSRKTKSSH